MRKVHFLKRLSYIFREKPDLVLNEAYTSCFELPLYNWIEALITKDFGTWLVKSGKFTSDQLSEIYTKICDEYREITHDTDSNYLFDLQKQIFDTDKKYLLVLAIVNQLKIHRNEELISILKNDFNFAFDYVDLAKDLEKTIRKAKGWLITLKLTENEFVELNGRSAAKEASRMDFIEQLAVLSEFQGYQIKPKETTVAEYVAIYNRFKANIEAKMKQNV